MSNIVAPIRLAIVHEQSGTALADAPWSASESPCRSLNRRRASVVAAMMPSNRGYSDVSIQTQTPNEQASVEG
jgi:hypothetical protein